MNKRTILFWSGITLLFLMLNAFTQSEANPQIEAAPNGNEIPAIQNGSYVILGVMNKDTFMRDTFTLRRKGEMVEMKYLKLLRDNSGNFYFRSTDNKIEDPIRGRMDLEAQLFSAYSTNIETAYHGGSFTFRCQMPKKQGEDLIGYGVLDKGYRKYKKVDGKWKSFSVVKEKMFKVIIRRVAVLIKDVRDNQTYKTVQIGNQFWMAENCRYLKSTDAEKAPDGIYENVDTKNSKHGHFYTWDAAKRFACPAGWHLPTRDEWTTLKKHLKEKIAGAKLKSNSEWYGSQANDPNAYDKVGFGAFPAGYFNPETETYKDKGMHAFFWTDDGNKENNRLAWYENIFWDYPGVYEFTDQKNYGLNCRCVQDDY
ncbi:MAG: hypothetical protein MK212_11005 [Saprospiraceae bacterium]|nr:hypothetical protein [Saprospiraceae bacterium]